MSEGRRTLKLKTQRDCTLCDLSRELVRGVLICRRSRSGTGRYDA